jgi:Uncharacterized protein family UPF0029
VLECGTPHSQWLVASSLLPTQCMRGFRAQNHHRTRTTPQYSQHESDTESVRRMAEEEEEEEAGEVVDDARACWPASEVLIDRRSRFQGFAARVHTEAEAERWRLQVAGTRSLRHCSHRMFVHRLRDETAGRESVRRDDDGESGAGQRMLTLLEQRDAVNVAVMVVRWYGGVSLGPARFRHISTCVARALDQLDQLEKEDHIVEITAHSPCRTAAKMKTKRKRRRR